MLEQLKEIDTAAVKQLAKLKKDEAQLERYRGEAEKRKADVSPAVYDRVIGDYDERMRALQKEAGPLRNQARGEFRKLEAICAEITAACEKARNDKEELEFRSAVGELSKTELTKRLKEPQEALAGLEKDLEEAAKVRQQFVAAFPSEEDLAAEVEADAGVEKPEAAGAPAATVLAPVAEVEKAAKKATKKGAKEEAEEEAKEAAATVLMTPAQAFKAAEEEEAAKPDAGATVVLPGVAQAEETFILSQTARLVVVGDKKTSAEYHLGFLNRVGRDTGNDIRIPSPKVSRKHALVSATPKGGFVIKDLGSQSGTYVNRERITEQELTDGDRVQVGDVELEFRSA